MNGWEIALILLVIWPLLETWLEHREIMARIENDRLELERCRCADDKKEEEEGEGGHYSTDYDEETTS
jgi:hypothetical protein